MLFICIKSWFFRNHLANFHQISHWSFCWNVIDSLFKWSCSIDFQAHIFFFRTKNCSNYISLVAMIGLEKCCITSACLQWLCHSGERTVARGLLFLFHYSCTWWYGEKDIYCPALGALVDFVHLVSGNLFQSWYREVKHRKLAKTSYAW